MAINLVNSGLFPQRGLRYCSIYPVGGSHVRSHLRNRREALGQGQISHVVTSSSQEIVPEIISVDKLIIQGTGVWMMGGGGACAVLAGARHALDPSSWTCPVQHPMLVESQLSVFDEYGIISDEVPVAQWIEHWSPEPGAQVQFLSGTL